MTDIGGAARRSSIWGLLLLLLALAACGESVDTGAASPSESPTVTSSPTPTESPAATCDEPAKTKIDLVTKNIHFNVKCLVVPAGKPLQVTLVNRDFVNHNFSIHTLEFDSVFTGDVAYPAERFSYKVPGLEAGQYLFRCDIHPRDMSGPLIVQ